MIKQDKHAQGHLAPTGLTAPQVASWLKALQRKSGVAALGLMAAGMAPCLVANAQGADDAKNYPTRPVRLIVAYGPGGVADLVGRVLASGMTKSLSQTVVVENRGGAGGTVGAASVASAAPDGYTILLTSPPMVAVAPTLLPGLRYDAVESFTPIGTVAITPNILVVHPSLPIRTLADMAKYGKGESKGALSFATSGPGSTGHLFGHMLQKAMGIEMTHIPYASGNVFPDVIAGRVSMAFDSVPATLGHLDTKRVRAIAVMADKRSPALPDVPTAAESGFPAVKLTFWLGVEGPAKMPAAIVAKLNVAIKDALATKEMRQQLTTLGAEPFITTPQEFDSLRRKDIEQLHKMVKEMGLGAG